MTYAGRPLYYYVHEGPGEVLCHNVNLNGGLWRVVGPNGSAGPAAWRAAGDELRQPTDALADAPDVALAQRAGQLVAAEDPHAGQAARRGRRRGPCGSGPRCTDASSATRPPGASTRTISSIARSGSSIR